ncbi:hypothetical protein GCM10022248_35080 [Nonomuraea soli]
MLLRQVGQVEVAGEGPRDLHRAVDVPLADHGRHLIEGDLTTTGADDGFTQPFDVLQQIGTALFGDHLTQQGSEQPHVSAELIGHFNDGTVARNHRSESSEAFSNAGYRSQVLD